MRPLRFATKPRPVAHAATDLLWAELTRQQEAPLAPATEAGLATYAPFAISLISQYQGELSPETLLAIAHSTLLQLLQNGEGRISSPDLPLRAALAAAIEAHEGRP